MERNFRRSNYIELQSWGGIDFSKGDVSEVIIPLNKKGYYEGKTEFQRFLKIMENCGTKISYQEFKYRGE